MILYLRFNKLIVSNNQNFYIFFNCTLEWFTIKIKWKKKNVPDCLDYFQQIGMHYIQMFVHDDLILISRLNFIQIYFKVQNFYSSINYGLKSKLLVERDIFLLHVHFFSNWITSWFQIEQLLHNYYTTITQLFLLLYIEILDKIKE